MSNDRDSKPKERERVRPRSRARRQRGRIRHRTRHRHGPTVAGIPVLEIGRRIEAYAQNPLASLLRESYWKAKGADVWITVCKNSLKARCSSSWAGVVRRLGRA